MAYNGYTPQRYNQRQSPYPMRYNNTQGQRFNQQIKKKSGVHRSGADKKNRFFISAWAVRRGQLIKYYATAYKNTHEYISKNGTKFKTMFVTITSPFGEMKTTALFNEAKQYLFIPSANTTILLKNKSVFTR